MFPRAALIPPCWPVSKSAKIEHPGHTSQPIAIAVTWSRDGMATMYLCSHSVRPGREELGDAGGVEASLRQAESGSESCSPSSHHDSVKLMIHNWVLCRDLKTKKGFVKCARILLRQTTGSTSSQEKILSEPPFKVKCEKSITNLNMSGQIKGTIPISIK